MKTRFRTTTAKRLLAVGPIAFCAVLLVGASPASASLPTPAILSWKATPTTLPSAGGSVTFTGTFKDAGTCTLSVSPGITGLPSTVSCTSNTYSKKLTVPPNTTGNAKDYTFSFYVKNSTGTTHASNIVVGVGAAPPPISITPTSFNFGDQGVGIAGVPQSFTVTNNSTTTSQDINAISLAAGPDPSDFVVTPGNCIVFLGATQSCDFQVTFNPQSGGVRSESVLVNDLSWGASGGHATLPISGTGEFGIASVSTTDLGFGDQGVDTASSWIPVTITNAGSVPLRIYSLVVQGSNAADFGLLGNTCAGAQGGNILSTNGQACTFEVQFTPSDSGSRSSTVIIADNTATAATAVTLSGAGDWTTSTLSSYSLAFPATAVGAPGVEMPITITNDSSTVSLTFTQYALTGTNTGDFTFLPNPVSDGVTEYCAGIHLELGPLQSCSFDVVFAPLNTGARTAQLVIYDNSNNATNPQAEVIDLSGTGDPPS